MLFCYIESELATPPELRKRKGLTGLPSVAFLDAGGDVLVTVPFDRRTMDGLRAHGARAGRYVELRTAAAAGDLRAGAEFLRMQLEERQLSLAQATARQAALGEIGDTELAETIGARIVDLEIEAALRAQSTAKKPRAALGPEFLEIHRNGPHPSVHVSRGFWFAILEWAEQERDVEAFEAALEGMRRALRTTDPDAAWVPRLLGDYEQKLRALRRSR